MKLSLILCDAKEGETQIQDGRLQIKNTYISACIQHNCTILTAIPMFSKSTNSMKLFPILCDANGCQQSKIAA